MVKWRIYILILFVLILTGCSSKYYCDDGDKLSGDKCVAQNKVVNAHLVCPSRYYLAGDMCYPMEGGHISRSFKASYGCTKGKLAGTVCIITNDTYPAYTKTTTTKATTTKITTTKATDSQKILYKYNIENVNYVKTLNYYRYNASYTGEFHGSYRGKVDITLYLQDDCDLFVNIKVSDDLKYYYASRSYCIADTDEENHLHIDTETGIRVNGGVTSSMQDISLDGKVNENSKSLVLDNTKYTNNLYKYLNDNNIDFILYNPNTHAIYKTDGTFINLDGTIAFYGDCEICGVEDKSSINISNYKIIEKEDKSIINQTTTTTTSRINNNSNQKVKVYMFYANGCPYCESQEEYLKALDGYGKTFELIKKELYIDIIEWKEGSDFDLGTKISYAFKSVGFEKADYKAIPFIVISDVYASSGYDSLLESVINEAYEKGDKDIVGCYSSGKTNCLNHLK